MSAVLQQPCCHCSVRRPISSHCSPIFSLRCWKSPLADLVICFLWACAHQHYPGLALMVPEVVALPVPILAVSFTPHVLIRTWCCLLAAPERLSLFCPSCLAKWKGEVSHMYGNCFVSDLLCLLGVVSFAVVDTFTLWSLSALAPEMCTSSWAVHKLACPAMYLVDHESCHWISLPGQRSRTDRDQPHVCQEAYSKPKIKSIQSKGNIQYCVPVPGVQKVFKRCLVFPGESMLLKCLNKSDVSFGRMATIQREENGDNNSWNFGGYKCQGRRSGYSSTSVLLGVVH